MTKLSRKRQRDSERNDTYLFQRARANPLIQNAAQRVLVDVEEAKTVRVGAAVELQIDSNNIAGGNEIGRQIANLQSTETDTMSRN